MTLAAFAAGCVVGAVLSLVGVLGLLVGAGVWLFGAIQRGIETERPGSKIETRRYPARVRSRSERPEFGVEFQ